MSENNIVNENADAQESVAADTAVAPTATTNVPVQTAHDDFDWNVDKRNVISYTNDEREKYDKVYDNTFVQLNDGELIKLIRRCKLQMDCNTWLSTSNCASKWSNWFLKYLLPTKYVNKHYWSYLLLYLKRSFSFYRP